MSAAQMFDINPHESDVFCIPSCNRRKPNLDITQLETFEFGNALQSYYPLLESVFDYLNCNDLKTCMLVNDTWKELATKVLQKRNYAGWVSFVLPGGILKSSKCFNYNNVSKSIIFYDYHYIKLNKYVCLHENNLDLSRMTFVEYVAKEVVPKNIDYCMLSSSSVTPIYLNDSVTKGKKTNNKTPRAVFQSVSLPEIQDVNISLFHCSPKNTKTVKTVFSKHIKPNEELKCLLLFTINNPYRFIETFLHTLLDGQDPRTLALGGGIVKGFKTFLEFQEQKTFRATDYFCITFQHEKGKNVEFNAASIVIPGDYLPEKEFEEYMQNLKHKSQKRTHGTAFRFCCAAKCDKDMETTLFNRHFPNIPLLGIDVDGETGWNTKTLQEVNSMQKSDEGSENKKFKMDLPKTLHQWSTILVLITWGKIVNGGVF